MNRLSIKEKIAFLQLVSEALDTLTSQQSWYLITLENGDRLIPHKDMLEEYEYQYLKYQAYEKLIEIISKEVK